MKFEDGDIVLVKVNEFTSWYRWLFAQLIRFIDGVYYHHAQIFVGGYLWEANDKVVPQMVDYNRGDEVIVLRLIRELTPEESEQLHRFTEIQKGRSYDYWGAMLHQLIYILLFRRVWLGRKSRRADERPYCTEFVSSLMNQVRGYFPDHYKIGPSGLLKRAPLYYYVVFEGKME